MDHELAILVRVKALERSNRRLKLLLTAFAALLLTSAKPQNVVTANGFVLVDSSGQVRARLDLSSRGTPALLMYHLNGSDALEVGVSNDLAALLMYDRNGQKRVDLGLNPSGAPSAVLSGVPPGGAALIARNTNNRETVVISPSR